MDLHEENAKGNLHVWQSRAEIEGYSVMNFDHIAAFEVPYRAELL